MKGSSGFTLLELMIAVSVAAILLVIGIPSFTSSSQQNCVVSGANALLTVLTLTRSEAIKRDVYVAACPSSNGTSCTNGLSWDKGYIVFSDPGKDGVLASASNIIKTEVPLLSCGTIGNNSYPNYIYFNGLGRVNTNGSFGVHANGNAAVQRTVSIAVSRVRICDQSKDTSCPTAP